MRTTPSCKKRSKAARRSSRLDRSASGRSAVSFARKRGSRPLEASNASRMKGTVIVKPWSGW
jgi:hypothetical protein